MTTTVRPGAAGAQPGAGAGADAGAGLGEVPGLGLRLRELRRAQGLSLEAAADRVGLSPAHLSRLETGARQPSLPVLLGLSRVYGRPVSELLGESPPRTPEPVIRAAAAEATRTGGWAYRAAGVTGGAMQPLRVSIPHGVQDSVVRIHPGEEWLHVLSGRLRFSLDEDEYLLEPGDSAHFDSLRPHRLAAATAGGVDLLFVHTLLRSPTADLCLGPHPFSGGVR